MSNWVVPSVAAEMLGVPVAVVLQRLQSGDLASRTDGGFTFVSLDLTQRQLIALVGPVETSPAVQAITEQELVELHPEPAEIGSESDASPYSIKHWKQFRRKVGNSRLRPTG